MRARGVIALLLLTAAVWAQRREREAERPVRHPVRGTRGAVAAGSEYAAEAGMRLFHQGGNAVDAGVAATLAAAVAEFSHFGFGGEAPILIRTAEGKVYAIAGVGTMPKSATAEFFRNRRLLPGEILRLDPGGLRGMVPVAGLMPALVPGMVDAVLVALRDFGTKSFAEVAAPAVELADGMVLDETRANSIRRVEPFFELWPTSRRVFLPGGRPPAAGEVFRQPDLAKTLRAMIAAEKRGRAAKGTRAGGIEAVRDFFYRGEIARRIDAFSRENEGLLRYEDMASFRLSPEAPVSTSFGGCEVFKPGFWSQGPAMIQALNILEGYDLKALRWNSADYIHTVVEALKLAYADRDTYYGDPKFNRIPAEELLSKKYAEARRKLILARASLEFQPGTAGGGPRPQHPAEAEPVRARIDDALASKDTTCVNTVDRNGVMFSATPSGAWMPPVIAGDTGIPLTQRAQSFLLVRGHPNELAGGKRPRVTLSPTLVTRGGKPYLALSTPGGDNQDQALLQVLFNIELFGMNAQAAVEVPRFQTRHLVSSFDNHAMNPGDLIVDDRIPEAVIQQLRQRGHKVSTRPRTASGAAPVVVRVTADGTVEAGADPFYYRVAHAW